MSEWSGFFNATKSGDSWDRVYLAEDLANFFSPLIRNGVFAGKSDGLQVIPSQPLDMSIQVSQGQAWISGYSYINDAYLSIPIDPADGSLNRIDRIVIQWDNSERKISAVCKKGTPAINANPPSIQNDANIKELCIAEISVLAGLTSIKEQHITDTRANTAICGWVTNLVNQVDTSTLFNQWKAAYTEQYKNNETYIKQQKDAWEEFFSSIQADIVLPVPSLADANKSLVVNSAGSGYELKSTSVSVSVTLSKSKWVSNQQSVAISISDKDNVIVSPAAESREQYIDSEIYCKQQYQGSLLFVCESAPEIDLTVGVLVIKYQGD